MSLAITAEQEDLRATTRRFLASVTPLTRVRETMSTATAFDADLWRRLTDELGLPGMAVPEQEGGVGLDLQALSYVAEECGRALAPGPLIATCGLCVPMLVAGEPGARRTWLPRLLAGEVGTVAWTTPGAGWERRTGAVLATCQSGRWYVTGTLEPVLEGAVASALLVVADSDAGSVVVAVDGEATGLSRVALPAFDQTRGLGRVELDAAPCALVAPPGDGDRMLSDALAIADALLAAEMVGGAQACLDMSVEYAKVRHQFGRPIGTFQAVKHKCAEVLVEIEGARAAARYAAWCGVENRPDLPAAATVAKAAAAETFFQAAAENVQVHGGIGFTWEHDAHLYFKRAKASRLMFGDVGAYRRHLADLIGI